MSATGAERVRRRVRFATPGMALTLGIGTIVLSVASLAFSVAVHSYSAGDGGSVVLVPGFGIVGLIVARRQPRNPMGWVLLGCAFCLALDDAASTYSVLDYRLHHVTLPLGPLAVLLQPAWAPGIGLLALSILLFPDGDLPAGKWRFGLLAFLALSVVWLVGAYGIAVDAIVSHRIHVDPTGNLLLEDHPTGAWAWWDVYQNVFFGAILLLGLSWLAAPIPAYRRATGMRRAQLKWLMLGVAVALASAALTTTSSNHSVSLLGVVGTIGLLGLPIGIGIGITRYRLYDIDRLISRTLSYALLTGSLIAVFIGLVLLTTRVLPFSSPVGVAAATLAAAGLFSPLRTRLQRLVDRRFNRARYDVEATVTAFTNQLRNAIDLDNISRELVAVVETSVAPKHTFLWIRPTTPQPDKQP